MTSEIDEDQATIDAEMLEAETLAETLGIKNYTICLKDPGIALSLDTVYKVSVLGEFVYIDTGLVGTTFNDLLKVIDGVYGLRLRTIYRRHHGSNKPKFTTYEDGIVAHCCGDDHTFLERISIDGTEITTFFGS